MNDDRRHITFLAGGGPRHQHDAAWGWSKALMIIRSGALRRSDPVRLATLYRADPIATADRQTEARARLRRSPTPRSPIALGNLSSRSAALRSC